LAHVEVNCCVLAVYVTALYGGTPPSIFPLEVVQRDLLGGATYVMVGGAWRLLFRFFSLSFLFSISSV